MEILVLGAGLAGLAAAQRLAAGGASVILLEARDRIGGRVLTRRVPELNYPIELSAEWLDPVGIVRQLLGGQGSPLVESAGRRWRRADGVLVETEEPYDRRLLRRLERVRGRDGSLLRALTLCCPQRQWEAAKSGLLSYVQGFHAADPERISRRWFLEAESTQSAEVSAFRAPEGADRVVMALFESLRGRNAAEATEAPASIQLNTVVREVHWRKGRVRVTALSPSGNERFEGEKLIVTLPLPLLQPGGRSRVRFQPALESKRRALDHLAMGLVVKLMLSFRRSFWREIRPFDDLLMLLGLEQPFPVWWTMRPREAPLLAGWVGGPPAQRLSGVSGDQLLALALGSLAAGLGVARSAVERELVGWHHHDWSSDPFARGAYSYVLSGGSNAWKSLARPLENTLFFAGEATAAHGFNATMEGAIASGWRAAREVLGE